MTSGNELDIIKLFNEKYGKDLVDPEKCKEIHKYYAEQIKHIESEVHSQSEFYTISLPFKFYFSLI